MSRTLGLVLLLLPPLPCLAQKEAEALPSGVLARFGTLRGSKAEVGHTARVSAVAWSPDGKTVGTGGWDNAVRLWDAGTGKMLHVGTGHTACIFFVAFSPDGKVLASGSRDHSIRLWDVATGKLIKQLKGHTNEVFGVVFSPDGKTLASGGYEGVARLWSMPEGKEVRVMKGTGNRVLTVQFTPDGKTLAASGESGTLVTWDVASGKLLNRFTGHKGYCYPMAMTPDGKTLASGGSDGTIRLWELSSGKERLRVHNGKHDVFALAFSADGRTLASASGEGNMIRLWETSTGKPRGQLDGHQGQIFRLMFDRGGKRLLSGGDDHTALSWDMTRVVGKPREAVAIREADLDGLWADLAAGNAGVAYAAVTRLGGDPERSVPFIGKRLVFEKPRENPDVARLIADLDSDRFQTRQQASTALEKLGLAAVPELRKALKAPPSPEARRRIEALLERYEDITRDPEELRLLRVVEVLEGIGTTQARGLLEKLTKAPQAEVADDARASLHRLANR